MPSTFRKERYEYSYWTRRAVPLRAGWARFYESVFFAFGTNVLENPRGNASRRRPLGRSARRPATAPPTAGLGPRLCGEGLQETGRRGPAPAPGQRAAASAVQTGDARLRVRRGARRPPAQRVRERPPRGPLPARFPTREGQHRQRCTNNGRRRSEFGHARPDRSSSRRRRGLVSRGTDARRPQVHHELRVLYFANCTGEYMGFGPTSRFAARECSPSNERGPFDLDARAQVPLPGDAAVLVAGPALCAHQVVHFCGRRRVSEGRAKHSRPASTRTLFRVKFPAGTSTPLDFFRCFRASTTRSRWRSRASRGRGRSS